MSRSNELIKTTAIYAVGSIGAKFVRFLMIPVFTFFLTQEELGLYDLILTGLLLFEPIITLKITESTFRWLLDNKSDAKKIISVSFSFILLSCLIGVFFISLIQLAGIEVPYALIVSCLLLVRVISNFFSECLRGLGENWQYSIYGISLTLSAFITSIASLYLFENKLIGLLLSNILSTMLVSAYFYFNSIRKFIEIRFDKKEVLQYLVYSTPLIPSAINWWGIKLLNRFVISSKLGLAANGVFAVAFTFPQIMIILGQIFYMAWQKNSIESFESKDRDNYYSSMFSKYVDVQFAMAFGILAISRLSFLLLFSREYENTFYYSFPLLLGSVYNGFGAFYAVSYLGAKKTFGAFLTSFLGLSVTVIILFAFTDEFGLWASSFANLFGFLALWIFRIWHSQKYAKLRVPWSKMILFVFTYTLLCVGHYVFQDSAIIMALIESFAMLFGLFLIRNILIKIVDSVLKKYKVWI